MASSKQTDYKTLRTKLRMNQTEFWSRIGVTQSGGSRYEGGRNAPEPTRIVVDLAYGTHRQVGQAARRYR